MNCWLNLFLGHHALVVRLEIDAQRLATQNFGPTPRALAAETRVFQVVGDSWVTEVDVLPDGRRQPKSLSAKALKDVLQQRMGHVAPRFAARGRSLCHMFAQNVDIIWAHFA